jgi:hypothetical protein
MNIRILVYLARHMALDAGARNWAQLVHSAC